MDSAEDTEIKKPDMAGGQPTIVLPTDSGDAIAPGHTAAGDAVTIGRAEQAAAPGQESAGTIFQMPDGTKYVANGNTVTPADPGWKSQPVSQQEQAAWDANKPENRSAAGWKSVPVTPEEQAAWTANKPGTVVQAPDGTHKLVHGNTVTDLPTRSSNPVKMLGGMTRGVVPGAAPTGGLDPGTPGTAVPMTAPAATPAKPAVSEYPDSRAPKDPEDLSGEWDGKNSNKYDGIIKAKAKKYGVEPHLLKRLVETESSFDPEAGSDKGARGLGQLMPETAVALGVDDATDPDQNLEGTAKYLSQLLKKYNGRKDLALAAYNTGPHNLHKAGEDISKAAAQTQLYVPSILGPLGTRAYIKQLMHKHKNDYTGALAEYKQAMSKAAGDAKPAAAAPTPSAPAAAPVNPEDKRLSSISPPTPMENKDPEAQALNTERSQAAGRLSANVAGDRGAVEAFKSGVTNADADITTADHPYAATAGHAARKFVDVGNKVAELAVPGLAINGPKPVAAGMRVLSGPAGLASPEVASDLKWGADKLDPPAKPVEGVAPQVTPAAAPTAPNPQPGKAPDATAGGTPGQGSPQQPAPQASQPDAFDTQQAREDAALQAQTKAATDQNDAVSDQTAQNLEDRQKLDDQFKTAEAARQAEGQRRVLEMDRLNDEISKKQINPDDRSTGQMILGSIGLAFGGLAEGKGVHSNAYDMIKAGLDRSMDAQKANIANQRAGVTEKGNIFARWFQMTGDARAAEHAARAEMIDFAKAKVDATALSTQNPVVRAAAQVASAKLAGDLLKQKHEWANTRSQIGLRSAETQGAELNNAASVLKMSRDQNAAANGMPVGAKMGEIVPLNLPGESVPRFVYGGSEGQKRVMAAAASTRGTVDSLDQMKKIVTTHPWQSLITSSGPGRDLQIALERTISQLYAARGQVLQPNEIIQKITEAGLSPSLFSSTDDYVNRLEQFKRSTMKEANDVIAGQTTSGQRYFPEGPSDFQPGALRK